MRTRLTSCITLAATLVSAAAIAGPNLPADDPDWTVLRDSLATGQSPDRLGGVQSVSEGATYGTMLPEAKFWFLPLQRLSLRAEAAAEHDRPYSLPRARPR